MSTHFLDPGGHLKGAHSDMYVLSDANDLPNLEGSSDGPQHVLL